MGLFARLLGKSAKTNEAPRPMLSLVALLPQSVPADIAAFRRVLQDCYPGHFQGDEKTSFIIAGSHPYEAFVKSLVPDHSGMFLIEAIPRPYTESSDFRATAPVALKAAIQAHTSWISVDAIQAIDSELDAYRFIGRTLAYLAPVDALALVHPQSGWTEAFTQETRERLRAKHVLDALGLAL
jgi:hypothetical protein